MVAFRQCWYGRRSPVSLSVPGGVGRLDSFAETLFPRKTTGMVRSILLWTRTAVCRESTAKREGGLGENVGMWLSLGDTCMLCFEGGHG